MSDRLTEILHEVGEEQRREEKRRREVEEVRKAAIDAVRQSRAARAAIYADEPVLANKRQSDRMFRLARSAKQRREMEE